MNSLNTIMLEGNLTRDPELRNTPKGTPVCKFGVATNRFYRYEEDLQKEVSFFDVEAWARTAERCSEELAKGRGVRVVGRLKQDRWTDGEGKNHSRIKIVAEHVEIKPKFNRSDDEQKADAAEAATEDHDEEVVAAMPF